ncbi:MAG: hypothetical protein R3F43_20515, partial [bacterium]
MNRLLHPAALAAALASLTSCDAPLPPSRPAELGIWRAGLTIEETAMETCDTPPELVDGLSRQLVDAIN